MRSAAPLAVHLALATALLGPAYVSAAEQPIMSAEQFAYQLSKKKALGNREQKVDLSSVTFELGSAQLTAQARAQLDEVAKALNMRAFQDKPVLVGGHTDARGTDEYNQQLSDARAMAVRDYLVNERGLDPARLQAQGFGEASPLAGLSPLDDSQRRVEFRLLPTS